MEHWCNSGNLMPMSAIPPLFLSTSESMYANYRTPVPLVECGAVAQTTNVGLSGRSPSPKRGTA